MEENNFLSHHGVPGMRWGVRRSRPKSSSGIRLFGKKKKNRSTHVTPVKKTVRDMSDSDIQKAISRMELEKRYNDLLSSQNRVQVSKGRQIVNSILESSAKNIGTQVLNYAAGSTINSIAGKEIVNVGGKKDDKK